MLFTLKRSNTSFICIRLTLPSMMTRGSFIYGRSTWNEAGFLTVQGSGEAVSRQGADLNAQGRGYRLMHVFQGIILLPPRRSIQSAQSISLKRNSDHRIGQKATPALFLKDIFSYFL